MKKWLWMACCAVFVLAGSVPASFGESRFGVGANYWVTVDSIDIEDVDENGF